MGIPNLPALSPHSKAQLEGGAIFAAFASIIVTIYALVQAFKRNKCTSDEKQSKYKDLLIYMIVNLSIFGLIIICNMFKKYSAAKIILLLSLMMLSSSVTWVAVKNKDTTKSGCDKDFMKSRLIWWSLGINIFLFLIGMVFILKN